MNKVNPAFSSPFSYKKIGGVVCVTLSYFFLAMKIIALKWLCCDIIMVNDWTLVDGRMEEMLKIIVSNMGQHTLVMMIPNLIMKQDAKRCTMKSLGSESKNQGWTKARKKIDEPARWCNSTAKSKGRLESRNKGNETAICCNSNSKIEDGGESRNKEEESAAWINSKEKGKGRGHSRNKEKESAWR